MPRGFPATFPAPDKYTSINSPSDHAGIVYCIRRYLCIREEVLHTKRRLEVDCQG